MNKKQLLFLGSIVSILLILLLIKTVWKNYQDNTAYPLQRTLSSLKRSAVDKILLKSVSGQVTVTKQGSSWKVNNFPADQDKINNFISNLLALQLTGIASTKQSSWNSLNISLDKAIEVTVNLRGSVSPLSIFVSSDGSALREADTTTVYALSVPLTIATDEKSWEDLTMLHVSDISDVHSITITDINGNNFPLIKNNTVWTLNGNTVADTKVSSLVDTLSTLTADHLVSSSAVGTYMQNAGTIQVMVVQRDAKNKKIGTSSVTFSFYGPVNNEYLVKKTGDNRNFIIEDSAYGQLVSIGNMLTNN